MREIGPGVDCSNSPPVRVAQEASRVWVLPTKVASMPMNRLSVKRTPRESSASHIELRYYKKGEPIDFPCAGSHAYLLGQSRIRATTTPAQPGRIHSNRHRHCLSSLIATSHIRANVNPSTMNRGHSSELHDLGTLAHALLKCRRPYPQCTQQQKTRQTSSHLIPRCCLDKAAAHSMHDMTE